MSLKKELNNRNKAFRDICQSHNVKSLYIFGSSLSEKFNPNQSDFDFLVEIEVDDPVEHGEKLLSLWDKLEEFFSRKVDLLTYSSVRNPVLRKKIDATKRIVYDGRGEKILI